MNSINCLSFFYRQNYMKRIKMKWSQSRFPLCIQRKRTAHERAKDLFASGEFSSGRKWADDAPKEKVDTNTVNLIASGACGAFVHGLEDEMFGKVSQFIIGHILTESGVKKGFYLCVFRGAYCCGGSFV